MDDEELYDEFGNYIGPELDSDDDSEDEQVQLTPPPRADPYCSLGDTASLLCILFTHDPSALHAPRLSVISCSSITRQ